MRKNVQFVTAAVLSVVPQKISDNSCCGSRYVTDKFHNCASIQVNQIRISATCQILAARFSVIMFTHVLHGSNLMATKWN